MGLTIHYGLKANANDPKQALQLVERFRQLALDLPFQSVGEIVDLKGDECDFQARRAELQNGDEKNEALFWLLIQSGKSVECPWNKRISRTVNPERIIGFDTWPGPGCESANIGLCLYPAEIEWEYEPEDDKRYQSAPKERFGWHHFSWRKWERHCKRIGRINKYGRPLQPEDFHETCKVPTKLAGWSWGSFCKTQYASNSECGGIPNFLRCHISVVTLLDRIAKLPGLKVRIDDEGKYGPSVYSDDYKESVEGGRKPTYTRQKGQYNPSALAKEVGDWNEMLAGFSGALSDALAGSEYHLKSPIKDFADFERLEFRGRNLKYLQPFLEAMKSLSVKNQSACQKG